MSDPHTDRRGERRDQVSTSADAGESDWLTLNVSVTQPAELRPIVGLTNTEFKRKLCVDKS